uniref:Kringle domain-containing protein n=1 Tax=Eptatretus burgeri TaxID=7764 RepID=A0A8C4WW16_EPTBU
CQKFTKSPILTHFRSRDRHDLRNLTSPPWPNVVWSMFPLGDLRENFCRNPGGDPKPWCYSIDPNIRWEYCDIPICGNCVHGDGSDYRGQVSMTRSGKTCQAWDSPFPHEHSRKSANYPCFDLESNYCRNPGGADTVWCYTTDHRKVWDTCAVPACEKNNQPERPANKLDSENCFSCIGEDYRGDVSHTTSGRACQRWDSQHPHKHDRTVERFPESGLTENFCRNPDGEAKPWCYTTNRDQRWEYCPIPRCTAPDPSTFTYDCVRGDGSTYHGQVSVTSTGKNCKPWSKQAQHEFGRTPENFPCKNLISNYCRNPGGVGNVWCYTTDTGDKWEKCEIPLSLSRTILYHKLELHRVFADCYRCRGADYRGQLRQSEFGKPCQQWDSQIPHEHTRTAERYPRSDLRENFCRNPDNELKPWCYTTDPFQRWEYCDVPLCSTISASHFLHQYAFSFDITIGKKPSYSGHVELHPWERYNISGTSFHNPLRPDLPALGCSKSSSARPHPRALPLQVSNSVLMAECCLCLSLLRNNINVSAIILRFASKAHGKKVYTAKVQKKKN